VEQIEESKSLNNTPQLTHEANNLSSQVSRERMRGDPATIKVPILSKKQIAFSTIARDQTILQDRTNVQ
jgi:hypothetical protein